MATINLDALAPTTLAKLFETLNSAETDDAIERSEITRIKIAVVDAGRRNCGREFLEMIGAA